MIREDKPEAVLQHRQGENVMSMTRQSLADTQRIVDHSVEAQGLRLIQALRAGPVSTISAAKELDIVHPPSTVRYLRRKGWGIITEWTYVSSGVGRRPHRVGLYVLTKEAA